MYHKWLLWLILSLFIVPSILIYQCGGEEEAQPSTEGGTSASETSETSTSSSSTSTTSSSTSNSTSTSTSSSTSSTTSSSLGGDRCEEAIPVNETYMNYNQSTGWYTFTYIDYSNISANWKLPNLQCQLSNETKADLFFIFTLSADTYVSFTAQAANDDILIAIFPYNCSNQPNCITSTDSAWEGGEEDLISVSLKPGIYLAVVFNYYYNSFSSPINVAFKFDPASKQCPTPISADVDEANHTGGDTSLDNLEDISPNQIIKGTFNDSTPGETDAYEINVPYGYKISVNGCIQSFESSDAKLVIWDANNSDWILASSYITATGTTVSWENLTGSDKDVKIGLLDGNNVHNYFNTLYKLYVKLISLSPLLGDNCENAIPVDTTNMSYDLVSRWYTISYTDYELLSSDWELPTSTCSLTGSKRDDLFFVFTLTEPAYVSFTAIAANDDIAIAIFPYDCSSQPNCISTTDSVSNGEEEDLRVLLEPSTDVGVYLGVVINKTSSRFTSTISTAFKIDTASDICTIVNPTVNEDPDSGLYSPQPANLGDIIQGTLNDYMWAGETDAYGPMTVSNGYDLVVTSCIQSFATNDAKLMIYNSSDSNIVIATSYVDALGTTIRWRNYTGRNIDVKLGIHDQDAYANNYANVLYKIESTAIDICQNVDWGSMGKVEVYIDVTDPNNARICSRNGGVGTISATSHGAYITYQPAAGDLTGTLGWSSNYIGSTGSDDCKVYNDCENLVTFEIELPSSATSAISVSGCDLWSVSASKDLTILRSNSNNFDFSDISDDGDCDECKCKNCNTTYACECGSTNEYFDQDNAIPIQLGKAYFLIAGWGNCGSYPAWALNEFAEFIISW